MLSENRFFLSRKEIKRICDEFGEGVREASARLAKSNDWTRYGKEMMEWCSAIRHYERSSIVSVENLLDDGTCKCG